MNTENKYSSISSHCYKKYKNIVDSNNRNRTYFISFSTLSKIDNIKVKSGLKIPCSSNCSHMIFELRDKFTPFKNIFTFSCLFDCSENNEFTKENIEDMLTFIDNIVHKLKFDKITGNLQEYIEPFGNQFIDGEQCCVCYEMTMTKTNSCGHYICRYCFQQLRQKFTCPVCRTKTHLDTDSDDCSCVEDDNEDDNEDE